MAFVERSSRRWPTRTRQCWLIHSGAALTRCTLQIKTRLLQSPSQKRTASFFCHSERSEESLLNQHALPTVTQRSFAFAQDDKHEGGLYQTALAKIAEITARGTLHQVDGELEQTNLPRVVYPLYDRAERFVFILDLP